MRLAKTLVATWLLCTSCPATASVVLSRLDLMQGTPLPPLPPPDIISSQSVSWAGRGGPSPAFNHKSAWQFRNYRVPDEADYLAFDYDVFVTDPNMGGVLVSVFHDGSVYASSSVNTTSMGTGSIHLASLAGELADFELRFGSPFFLGPNDIRAILRDVRILGTIPGDYNDNGRVEQADLDLVLLNH